MSAMPSHPFPVLYHSREYSDRLLHIGYFFIVTVVVAPKHVADVAGSDKLKVAVTVAP